MFTVHHIMHTTCVSCISVSRGYLHSREGAAAAGEGEGTDPAEIDISKYVAHADSRILIAMFQMAVWNQWKWNTGISILALGICSNAPFQLAILFHFPILPLGGTCMEVTYSVT